MAMNVLTDRINTYFAILLITLTGAGASLMIIRIAERDADSFAASYFSGVYEIGAQASRER